MFWGLESNIPHCFASRKRASHSISLGLIWGCYHLSRGWEAARRWLVRDVYGWGLGSGWSLNLYSVICEWPRAIPNWCEWGGPPRKDTSLRSSFPRTVKLRRVWSAKNPIPVQWLDVNTGLLVEPKDRQMLDERHPASEKVKWRERGSLIARRFYKKRGGKESKISFTSVAFLEPWRWHLQVLLKFILSCCPKKLKSSIMLHKMIWVFCN